MKRTSLVTLLGVAAVLAWAVPALAQHPLHPYYSNARAQIGNGLPIPITFDAPPYGRVRPVPGATAMGSAMKGAAISLKASALSAPVITKNIGVWKSNNKVFQVQTSLGLKVPKVAGTLMLNGRTGPTMVTWCPGLKKSVTGAISALPTGTSVVGYNPGCAFPAPSLDPRPHAINSALKYSKTVGQFGGTGQGLVIGGR